MNSKAVLKIDWATFEAAKFACENWHYSKAMPSGKLVKVGAWENGRFIGVVIFGMGATYNIASPYKLGVFEVCELVRIALTKHENPVSKIMAIALKFLKKSNPGLKLVVSYADKDQDHHGGIYQATNWIYEGLFGEDTAGAMIIKGKRIHRRSIYAAYGTSSISAIRKKIDPKAVFSYTKGKHKYLYPLDNETRQNIIRLAKPYPKRASSKEIVASGCQPEEGSENLTGALQPSLTGQLANWPTG